MKKKQRCFVKRFAALVAALCLSCSLMLPFASASSVPSEADMPDLNTFSSHYGSWFVWRKVIASPYTYYELINSPIVRSGSSFSLPYEASYPSDPFDISVIDHSGTTYVYGCSYPCPLRGVTGFWSDLPSFRVGNFSSYGQSVIRAYSSRSSSSDYYLFLSPAFSSSDFSMSALSSSASVDFASFSSFYPCYPFAYRYYTSSNHVGYALQGGQKATITPDSGKVNVFDPQSVLSLSSTRIFRPFSTFTSPDLSRTFLSSSLGVVVVKKPADSYVTLSSEFGTSAPYVFSLLVPAAVLPDIKVGDWISNDPEDLQDTITNDFGVDSDKLKDSKDSITDWSNTSSVDSDVASGASGLLGGLFQNLGTFLFSVSLLCFGAVVLRMLIRKAVDG